MWTPLARAVSDAGTQSRHQGTPMHTHTHVHTELGQQPQWNCHCHLVSPSTASKAEIKGTAVQSHPTHSQTWSHLPETLGTTDLLGGGKATFYSSRRPPHWLVGWPS